MSSAFTSLISKIENYYADRDYTTEDAEHLSRLAIVEYANTKNALVASARQVSVASIDSIIETAIHLNLDADPSEWMLFAANAVDNVLNYAHEGIIASGLGEYTDFLPLGHPSRTNRDAMTASALSRVTAMWTAGDPRIASEQARLDVYAAYSTRPGTIEAEYAGAKLSALVAAGYVPEDVVLPITAAFKMSFAMRSAMAKALAAVRRRHRDGRFAEEFGRLKGFFSRKDGSIFSENARIVGAEPNTNNFQIEIKDSPEIPDGVYTIDAAKTLPVKAVLSKRALSKVKGLKMNSTIANPSKADKASAVPLDEFLKTRTDAPLGWTKNEDGSFTSKSGQTVRAVDKAPEGDFMTEGAGESGQIDPNQPIFEITDKDGKTLGVAQDWAGLNKIGMSYDALNGEGDGTKDEPGLDQNVEDLPEFIDGPDGKRVRVDGKYGTSYQDVGKNWYDKLIDFDHLSDPQNWSQFKDGDATYTSPDGRLKLTWEADGEGDVGFGAKDLSGIGIEYDGQEVASFRATQRDLEEGDIVDGLKEALDKQSWFSPDNLVKSEDFGNTYSYDGDKGYVKITPQFRDGKFVGYKVEKEASDLIDENREGFYSNSANFKTKEEAFADAEKFAKILNDPDKLSELLNDSYYDDPGLDQKAGDASRPDLIKAEEYVKEFKEAVGDKPRSWRSKDGRVRISRVMNDQDIQDDVIKNMDEWSIKVDGKEVGRLNAGSYGDKSIDELNNPTNGSYLGLKNIIEGGLSGDPEKARADALADWRAADEAKRNTPEAIAEREKNARIRAEMDQHRKDAAEARKAVDVNDFMGNEESIAEAIANYDGDRATEVDLGNGFMADFGSWDSEGEGEDYREYRYVDVYPVDENATQSISFKETRDESGDMLSDGSEVGDAIYEMLDREAGNVGKGFNPKNLTYSKVAGKDVTPGLDQSAGPSSTPLEENPDRISLKPVPVDKLNDPKYRGLQGYEGLFSYEGADGSYATLESVDTPDRKGSLTTWRATLKDKDGNVIAQKSFKENQKTQADSQAMEWLNKAIAKHNASENKKANGGLSTKQMEPATDKQYALLDELNSERDGIDPVTQKAIDDALANRNLSKAQISSLFGELTKKPFKPDIDPNKPTERQINSLQGYLLTKELSDQEVNDILEQLDAGLDRAGIESLTAKLRRRPDRQPVEGLDQNAGEGYQEGETIDDIADDIRTRGNDIVDQIEDLGPVDGEASDEFERRIGGLRLKVNDFADTVRVNNQDIVERSGIDPNRDVSGTDFDSLYDELDALASEGKKRRADAAYFPGQPSRYYRSGESSDEGLDQAAGIDSSFDDEYDSAHDSVSRKIDEALDDYENGLNDQGLSESEIADKMQEAQEIAEKLREASYYADSLDVSRALSGDKTDGIFNGIANEIDKNIDALDKRSQKNRSDADQAKADAVQSAIDGEDSDFLEDLLNDQSYSEYHSEIEDALADINARNGGEEPGLDQAPGNSEWTKELRYTGANGSRIDASPKSADKDIRDRIDAIIEKGVTDGKARLAELEANGEGDSDEAKELKRGIDQFGWAARSSKFKSNERYMSKEGPFEGPFNEVKQAWEEQISRDTERANKNQELAKNWADLDKDQKDEIISKVEDYFDEWEKEDPVDFRASLFDLAKDHPDGRRVLEKPWQYVEEFIDDKYSSDEEGLGYIFDSAGINGPNDGSSGLDQAPGKTLSPKMMEPATEAQYSYLKNLSETKADIDPETAQAIKEALDSNNLTKAQAGAFIGKLRVLGDKENMGQYGKPSQKMIDSVNRDVYAKGLSPEDREEILKNLENRSKGDVSSIISMLKEMDDVEGGIEKYIDSLREKGDVEALKRLRADERYGRWSSQMDDALAKMDSGDQGLDQAPGKKSSYNPQVNKDEYASLADEVENSDEIGYAFLNREFVDGLDLTDPEDGYSLYTELMDAYKSMRPTSEEGKALEARLKQAADDLLAKIEAELGPIEAAKRDKDDLGSSFEFDSAVDDLPDFLDYYFPTDVSDGMRNGDGGSVGDVRGGGWEASLFQDEETGKWKVDMTSPGQDSESYSQEFDDQDEAADWAANELSDNNSMARNRDVGILAEDGLAGLIAEYGDDPEELAGVLEGVIGWLRGTSRGQADNIASKLGDYVDRLREQIAKNPKA